MRYSYETENAFHGTIREDAESIWRTRKFHPPASDLRFGPGIYFWENSVIAAQQWVYRFYRNRPRNDYGIIRATVRAEALLDLLTREHYRALTVATNRVARARGVPITSVKHGAVLAVMVQEGLIDAARIAFGTSGETRVHPQTELVAPLDVILCIFEPNNIVVTEFIDSENQ